MKFIDFFAGIGGIRLGLEQAGHECVGFCEWDKFARTAYKAMYDTEGEWECHDVRTASSMELPKADLWCFGFPCQDISVAGKQKGLQEGERSGLFYEVMRLLAGLRQEDRPRWLFVENVKNLLSIGSGCDFLRLLIEVGRYTVPDLRSDSPISGHSPPLIRPRTSGTFPQGKALNHFKVRRESLWKATKESLFSFWKRPGC